MDKKVFVFVLCAYELSIYGTCMYAACLCGHCEQRNAQVFLFNLMLCTISMMLIFVFI